MYNLKDNNYNVNVRQDEPKLKLWTSAGLMLTYNCPAACKFCYYNCNPQKKGLMNIETAISAWQSLKDLAGDSAKIHLTGGEPFVYWEHLQELLKKANKMQLGKIDVVETNAYWAQGQTQIRERLNFLAEHNVKRLKISYDPFHAEFIDYEKVKRLADIAMEILGPDRCQVRWQEYLDNPIDMQNLSEKEKQAQYIATLKKYPCRFTGRAGSDLAQQFADKRPEQLEDQNCKKNFLSAKGVHIDPFGNVFSGVCSGIIVGNINQKSLAQIWQDFNPTKMDFFCVLFNSGPVGLLQKAVKSGYRKRRLYVDKCHMCTDLTQFFFDNGLLRPIIGPVQYYT
ncbi:MAG: 4Fe-4S cluster-binding domain-containing protein [Anaerohalosphaeraceae bacterium]|nr:4Fe-4S cluster-binding domain-containing protein [Anaerohalosphaeraceae bacterium]